MRYIVYIVLFF